MKLINKKTGEIAEPFGITCIGDRTFVQFNDGKGTFKFEAHSLAELNEEWEDYEEDKTYWYIDSDGEIMSKSMAWFTQEQVVVGNIFERKEEAEKALEKLMAWKRLKEKGFRFKTWGWEDSSNNEYTIYFTLDSKSEDAVDLDLLFGGEE